MFNRCLALHDGLRTDRVALLPKEEFACVVQRHLPQALLSEGLHGLKSTCMSYERAGSPPLRSSTIWVIESSLPLEILKLQNLMVCSTWSIFSRKTFSLSESLALPMSYLNPSVLLGSICMRSASPAPGPTAPPPGPLRLTATARMLAPTIESPAQSAPHTALAAAESTTAPAAASLPIRIAPSTSGMACAAG